MISVLILTFNEEINIAGCIGSLPWHTDIHVLDSCSTDRTRAIAGASSAKVTVREFTHYADQRNFGLALPFIHDWIVMLDADERMTPDLAAEIENVLATVDANVAMFRVRRKDIFMGRWLRRSSGYPTWFARVIRRGRVRVEREINEIYSADGIALPLRGHIEHYPFNKGLEWWFTRHNSYSTAEARLLLAGERERFRIIDLLSRDPARRRAAQKGIASRVPGRPFLAFLYLYVVRLGFLDGRAGYRYATMRLAYEIMIDAKAEYAHVAALEKVSLTTPLPHRHRSKRR